jgi:hypothetical protein
MIERAPRRSAVQLHEYFLTQFADQKAHDGGEFFTPVSLVSLIANVIEPARRIIIERQAGETWGQAIVQQLAGDLQREFPGKADFPLPTSGG